MLAAAAAEGDTTVLRPSSKRYRFPWLESYDTEDMLVNRILPPPGYRRVEVPAGSFADWLRQLPLKKGMPYVKLYNGQRKGNQSAHFAVLNMDVGTQDLQQCADAVMRLRAEYLYQAQRYDLIGFNFTNDFPAEYAKWRSGYRTAQKGNKTTWVKKAKADGSIRNVQKIPDPSVSIRRYVVVEQRNETDCGG